MDATWRYDSRPFDEALSREGFRNEFSLKSFFTEGVDGRKKRCRMGGSPRTKRLGTVPEKRCQANDL